MDRQLLTRFEPFSRLDYSALTTLVQHCRVMTLPAGRLLMRPGGPIRGNYYLARGRLRIGGFGKGRELGAGAPGARQPVLASGELAVKVLTLTPATVLWVDIAGIGFLLGPDGSGVYQVEELEGLDGGEWLRVFLGSVVGRCLAMSEVAQLLRKADKLTVGAGQRIISTGEPGNGFYLVEEGAARVQRNGTTVAQLPAGAFFGEESLLSRRCRNADVEMTCDGRLLFFAAETFESILLPAVLRPRSDVQDSGIVRTVIDLDVLNDVDPRHLAGRLEPAGRYRLQGGTAAARRHVAFLLTTAGIDVLLPS